MKRFLTILLLILAVGLAPMVSFAQHNSPSAADQKASKPGDGVAKPGGGCPGCPMKDKMMGGAEDWKAKHEKMKQDVEAMDKRLDDMVAAMNSATGDQKVTAMSNVINELVAQRKQMMEMFRSSHGKMGGMRGSCKGCPMMDKGKKGKMHRQHHGEKQGV